MRVLGIDYGAKKIGIAIGDTETKVASPYSVIKQTASIMTEIATIISSEDIARIIVGVPVGLSGTQSAQYKDAEEFIERLRAEVQIPVLMENEVLSTSAARELTRGHGRQRPDDDVAAMVILQGYFDSLS